MPLDRIVSCLRSRQRLVLRSRLPFDAPSNSIQHTQPDPNNSRPHVVS
jgi:hypothetical protein